ncbi:MAG: VC_2705 family sodium/solute symporter, partial [Rhodocyclaceae bacterium]|nr:VC_2705 family sodium/solute symporter [Rhodocyclaceae bacterium]
MDVFRRRLKFVYGWYTLGFALFVLGLALAERLGLPNKWIGYVFMIATIALYASIGVMSRTADVAEYYVAGRRVPGFFNGMATAADWMSAASFIGLAGSLYLGGYQGLAFVLGWTGGYVLVALLLAPYLRRFGQFTIPDYLGARYGGNLARCMGSIGAVLASFIYVVAQIYGVGLITSRFVGLEFEIGVFVGLAGVLVCSFLGGMRAVTWTQVAQYIILLVAYLVPVVILSYKVAGVPIPQAMYGSVLEKLGAKEQALFDSPKEIEVREHFARRAEELGRKIDALPQSLIDERKRLILRLEEIKQRAQSSATAVSGAARALRELPATPEAAREVWSATKAELEAKSRRPLPHAAAYPGSDTEDSATMRINFITLVIVLMIGTASLPHILMRYYTTPSVQEARE